MNNKQSSKYNSKQVGKQNFAGTQVGQNFDAEFAAETGAAGAGAAGKAVKGKSQKPQ